jgi:methionine-rich copper-binding protein CopC
MTARLTIAALLGLLATAALAHTKLSLSVPAAGAALERSPAQIVLEFAEDVRLTAVTLTDAAGTAHTLGALPREPAVRFALDLPTPLTPGAYVIAWRAVGGDTHLVSGDVAFTVGGAAHGH